MPLREVRTFAKSLGGSPTNVAVGAARYGHRPAVITKVGADGFGDYVRAALRGFGVDDRFVGTDPELRTPVVFCELLPPEAPAILFYRQPTAPDMRISSDELDLDAIREPGSSGRPAPGSRPSRAGRRPSRRWRRAGGRRDGPRPRPPSHVLVLPGGGGEQQRRALAHATVAVGNVEECAVAVGPARRRSRRRGSATWGSTSRS